MEEIKTLLRTDMNESGQDKSGIAAAATGSGETHQIISSSKIVDLPNSRPLRKTKCKIRSSEDLSLPQLEQPVARYFSVVWMKDQHYVYDEEYRQYFETSLIKSNKHVWYEEFAFVGGKV